MRLHFYCRQKAVRTEAALLPLLQTLSIRGYEDKITDMEDYWKNISKNSTMMYNA